MTRRLGGAGLRVLGAATTVVDGPPDPAELSGLTLVSIAGIADPLRPQAREAIALCRTAGVAVKMITGDHADTAAAIARELDITGEVVTGAELDRMAPEELRERIDGIGVFARVAPEQKVAIVRALSGRGHIVAMTGDGVNDAAALRAVHIGIAMGVTGTDVAKEPPSPLPAGHRHRRHPDPAGRLAGRTARAADGGRAAVDQHHHGRAARDGAGGRPRRRRRDAAPAARRGGADPRRPPPARHRPGGRAR